MKDIPLSNDVSCYNSREREKWKNGKEKWMREIVSFVWHSKGAFCA